MIQLLLEEVEGLNGDDIVNIIYDIRGYKETMKNIEEKEEIERKNYEELTQPDPEK